MSRILRTKFDNSRCKACGTDIPYGTNVRHTGGYGVTCMSCPHAPDLAPQQPSGQTLASELIARCEQACAEARAETERYKAALQTAREMLATVTRERDALDRRLTDLTDDRAAYSKAMTMGALFDAAPVEIDNEESGSIEDDDCPI